MGLAGVTARYHRKLRSKECAGKMPRQDVVSDSGRLSEGVSASVGVAVFFSDVQRSMQ
jgi:hypothetical protein